MDATTVQSHPSESETNGRQLNSAPAKAPPRAQTRTILVIAFIVFAVLIVFLVLGIVYRSERDHALAADASVTVNTPPEVTVVYPVAAAASVWSLPGSTQAVQDAIIYARVSGYLSKRYVDIGERVKAGQLLAEILSPELDQQLSQAKANLQQAQKQLDLQKANLGLARATMNRYKGADQENAVAKEAVDQAVAGYGTAQASVAAAEASVASNQATVGQYEAVTSFERVLAPFDGIITQRNVDVGALITAGSPTNNTSVAPTSVTGGATGLFEVSQFDTLRVFVSVPQVAAPNVTVGMEAQVAVRGALTAPAEATVTRTANALDPGTRTLLTEVDVPNSSHGLLPGEFVYVAFKIRPSGRRWNLPATALIFNTDGTQVMLVGTGNKLHLQKVTVGRDFGDTIDVQAGLSGGETIVEQPDVSLHDGQVITPVEAQHAPKN
ncbi:MAG: efflux RND transporter periplasmic adaptor subunit [Planctomycetota bacterium]|nr:efflux RND transporter periplasmic adaptor subunit [Planctomycetota bacterium]